MKKYFISFLTGALAVAIGAFGAHALAPFMTNHGKEIYITGNRYHFYHALLMVIICVLLSTKGNHRMLNIAWTFALAGIILFSGSLYLLAVKDALPFPAQILGPVTPLGGMFFITSWILLAVYSFRLKHPTQN